MRSVSALAVGALAVSFVLAACGSDDSSKTKAGGSYKEVASAVANPTGTLSTDNAVSVAKAFEKIDSAGAAGRRLEGTGQTTSEQQSCPNGGSYSMTASGSDSAGTADLKYNNCCYSEGCCINGTGGFYYSTSSTTTATDYNICASYNLSVACGSESGALNYEGCVGSSGEWVYVVTVDGKTYSVSGSYSGGSGTLTITDSKDTWTCTYSDGDGSCSGTSGEFTF